MPRSIVVLATLATLVSGLLVSNAAEARYGRRAAFIGGVAAGAVAGAAVRSTRDNYGYGYRYAAPGAAYPRCY